MMGKVNIDHSSFNSPQGDSATQGVSATRAVPATERLNQSKTQWLQMPLGGSKARSHGQLPAGLCRLRVQLAAAASRLALHALAVPLSTVGGETL
jgi:hypothetical protein